MKIFLVIAVLSLVLAGTATAAPRAHKAPPSTTTCSWYVYVVVGTQTGAFQVPSKAEALYLEGIAKMNGWKAAIACVS